MSVVAPFPNPRDRRPIASFERHEWTRILDLYARMVAAGHWRDYALSIDPDADFAAISANRASFGVSWPKLEFGAAKLIV